MPQGGSGGAGKAAGLGALGCFGLFALVAIIAVAAGGTAYIDAGGFILLLLIGAGLGLGVWAIYSKGRRDAGAMDNRYGAPPAKSVDELIMEAEEDLREGRITRDEYERRRRRAWGYPE